LTEQQLRPSQVDLVDYWRVPDILQQTSSSVITQTAPTGRVWKRTLPSVMGPGTIYVPGKILKFYIKICTFWHRLFIFGEGERIGVGKKTLSPRIFNFLISPRHERTIQQKLSDAASEAHGRRFVFSHQLAQEIENLTPSIDAYLLEGHSCKISSRSVLKRPRHA